MLKNTRAIKVLKVNNSAIEERGQIESVKFSAVKISINNNWSTVKKIKKGLGQIWRPNSTLNNYALKEKKADFAGKFENWCNFTFQFF